MGWTIYTAKKSIELRGAYKCSKCNKINYFEHVISEKVVEQKNGAWHSKNYREENLGNVSDQVESAMSARIMNIMQEAAERKYLSADFKGRCQYCGNYEPWQRIHYRFSDEIIFKIIFYVIIISLILLIFKEFIAFIIISILGSLLGFSYHMIKKTNIKKREKEIAMLNPESLPHLFWNDEMLYDYMKKNDPETLKIFLEQKAVENGDGELCEVCGAMLRQNQKICHVCGQKIER